MVVGYVRPSEEDPECKIQLQTLARSGYDHLYREEHSSPKRRVALQKLLSEVQPRDTIVVAKLFSFADSTRHLAELLEHLHRSQVYLYSIKEDIHTDPSFERKQTFREVVNLLLEFQSDLISENTKKGLYAAKQKGKKPGRPRKPDANVQRAIEMYQSQQFTLAEIKKETGISKTTLYRYLEK